MFNHIVFRPRTASQNVLFGPCEANRKLPYSEYTSAKKDHVEARCRRLTRVPELMATLAIREPFLKKTKNEKTKEKPMGRLRTCFKHFSVLERSAGLTLVFAFLFMSPLLCHGQTGPIRLGVNLETTGNMAW
jgi:hypothetical protein